MICVARHLFTKVICYDTGRKNTWEYLITDVKFAREDFQIRAISKGIWYLTMQRGMLVVYVEEATLIKMT